MKKEETEKAINIYTNQPTKIINIIVPTFWQAVKIGWAFTWGVFIGFGSFLAIGNAIDFLLKR